VVITAQRRTNQCTRRTIRLLAALGGSARIGTTYCHIATRPKYEIAPPVQQSHTEIPLQTCFKAGSYQLGEPFAAQDQGPTSVIPKLLKMEVLKRRTRYYQVFLADELTMVPGIEANEGLSLARNPRTHLFNGNW